MPSIPWTIAILGPVANSPLSWRNPHRSRRTDDLFLARNDASNDGYLGGLYGLGLVQRSDAGRLPLRIMSTRRARSTLSRYIVVLLLNPSS